MTLPRPELGDPLSAGGDTRVLEALATRRSSPAQALGAPGPSREQVADLLQIAVRVPDHGKLAPWRFVVIEPQAKAKLVEKLRLRAAEMDEPDSKAAKLGKLAAAPVSILVVSKRIEGHKVPVWEQ